VNEEEITVVVEETLLQEPGSAADLREEASPVGGHEAASTSGEETEVLPSSPSDTLTLEEVGDVQPAEAESEAEEEAGPKPQWYVVHSYSGYENRVKKNLEQRIESMGMQDKIFQVIVPTEEEIEIRDGERRIVERRVFPGYVLVQMILDETSWHVVRNTPAVTGFVGIGNKPTPLSDEEVEKILKRIEAAEPKIKVSFKVGQKVRVIEGAFADFVGVVDDLYPEKGKARIMVSIFGRETPVEVDLLHLERV